MRETIRNKSKRARDIRALSRSKIAVSSINYKITLTIELLG